MVHAVFDVSPDSRYSKDFWQRYEIPTRTAIAKVQECIGDWIVYRQTGIRGYIAVAYVEDVVPDSGRPGFSVAAVSQYLPFRSPVSLKPKGRYAEQSLRDILRPIHIGQFLQGNPIRQLWPLDFAEIVLAGFSSTLKVEDDAVAIAGDLLGLDEQAVDFWGDEPAPRAIREFLARRKFRDANFRLDVCGRCGYRCIFTDISMSDGRLYEVDAAHWRSVAADGPDVVQNGSAVMKSLHWAVDAHQISIDEEYRPLIAPGRIPEGLLPLFPPAGERVYLPRNPRDWPDQSFLAYHRTLFRKKNKM